MVLVEAEIVIEEVEELFLHEVDLCDVEEDCVFCPVDVFWGRVIEVFCGYDKDCEEDAVSGAGHAYGGMILVERQRCDIDVGVADLLPS